MKGSIIASQIINDMKKEEYYKRKVQRNKCVIDSKKQCDICKYQYICENCEVKDEVQM